MIDPEKKEDFKRLYDAENYSIQKLEPFRKKRKDLIDCFVGSEYSGDMKVKEVYLNLIALSVSISVRRIAYQAPAPNVTSAYKKSLPLAADLEAALKDQVEDIELGDTLRRAVTDALFSPMAILKAGLNVVDKEEMAGEEVDITNEFVKKVSFDDFIIDMSGRSAHNPAFEGDQYALTKSEFKELYPDHNLEKDTGKNTEEDTSYRTENISHEKTNRDTGLEDDVILRDIWLTKEKLMVTHLANKPEKALHVVEYDTNDRSPYHKLSFQEVPDNTMPLPPMGLTKQMHILANNLFRRIASQAEDQKRVAVFDTEEAAKNFEKADDGDAMTSQNVNADEVETGGVDNNNFALLVQLKDMFSWASGNLDSMGGLSPMSDTAKQDKLLFQSSSAQLDDMKLRTIKFTRKLYKKLAWYEWTDPVRVRELQKPVKGTDVSVPVLWTPETREGDFLDFNIDIWPQSMQDEAPSVKLKKINDILMNLIIPLLPELNKQGLALDMERIVSMISDYSNIPELSEIIVSLDQEKQPEQPAQQKGNKSPQTKRTYERVNRPGATRVGKDQALVQALVGGNPQKAEKESISRGST